jgi:hypothetical protein
MVLRRRFEPESSNYRRLPADPETGDAPCIDSLNEGHPADLAWGAA